MQTDRRITIQEYYKSFLSLQGAFAIICGLLPPVSNFLLPGRIFPPLGNETNLSQAFVLLFGLAVTYLVFFLCRDSTTLTVHRAIRACFLLAVIFFCFYFGLHMRFVRSIPVPSTHGEVNVSVGYTRTNFANTTFKADNDWDMLRYRGTDDEEIMRLWTTTSIYVARSTLLFSYLGSMLALIALASFGVLLHVRDRNSSAAGLIFQVRR